MRVSGGRVETPTIGLRGALSSPRLDAARKTGALGPPEGSGDRSGADLERSVSQSGLIRPAEACRPP